MPAFTLNAVEFRMADENDRVLYDRMDSVEGARLNMTYYVAWAQRLQARLALLGTTTCESTGGVQPHGYLSRTLPHFIEWDEDPGGERRLWCKSVQTIPGGPVRAAVGDGPEHTDAMLKVVYEWTPYELFEDEDVLDVDGFPDETTLDRYVSYPAPKSKNNVRQAKGGMWRWKGDHKDFTEASFINLPDMEYSAIWWQVPWECIPWETIRGTLNTANNAIFGPWAFPIGFAYLHDVSFQQIRLPDAQLAANITYTWEYCTHGANFFPRADSAAGAFTFEEIEAKDGTGKQPYPKANHSLLFRPA